MATKPVVPVASWSRPGGEGDVGRPVTIGDALAQAADRWPLKTAVVAPAGAGRPRRTWTFAELRDDAERVAHGLLRRFQPGEHVAVWAANSPEWLLVEMGAALAG